MLIMSRQISNVLNLKMVLCQGGVGGPAQDDVLHRHHLHHPPSQEDRSLGEEDQHSALAVRLNTEQNAGRSYKNSDKVTKHIKRRMDISNPWVSLPIFMK